MKVKKAAAIMMVSVMALSAVGCGGSSDASSDGAADKASDAAED